MENKYIQIILADMGSQRKLAEFLGVTSPAVNRALKRGGFSYFLAKKLSNKYQIPVDKIMNPTLLDIKQG